MVDSIGSKSLSSAVQPVAAATRLARVEAAVQSGNTLDAALQLSSLSQADMRPPIDVTRVAELRRQVQAGTYKLDPEQTAERMLAVKQEWTSK